MAQQNKNSNQPEGFGGFDDLISEFSEDLVMPPQAKPVSPATSTASRSEPTKTPPPAPPRSNDPPKPVSAAKPNTAQDTQLIHLDDWIEMTAAESPKPPTQPQAPKPEVRVIVEPKPIPSSLPNGKENGSREAMWIIAIVCGAIFLLSLFIGTDKNQTSSKTSSRMTTQSNPVVNSSTATTRSEPTYNNSAVQKSTIEGRYLDNKDGTIKDTRTNLQWMRCSLGQEWMMNTCVGKPSEYQWDMALSKAKDLNKNSGYAGYKDWRLPNSGELVTLVYCSSNQPKKWNDSGTICQGSYEKPTIYSQAFPNTPASVFWSSTLYTIDPSKGLGVGFHVGYLYAFSKGGENHIRLVRDTTSSISSSSITSQSNPIVTPSKTAIRSESNTTATVEESRPVALSKPSTPKSEPDPLVKEIQKKLLSLGYYPGSADGYIRQKTLNAIKQFQKDNRLPLDSKISEGLLKNLDLGKSRVDRQVRQEQTPVQIKPQSESKSSSKNPDVKKDQEKCTQIRQEMNLYSSRMAQKNLDDIVGYDQAYKKYQQNCGKL